MCSNDKRVMGEWLWGVPKLSRELSNGRILKPQFVQKVVQVVTDGHLKLKFNKNGVQGAKILSKNYLVRSWIQAPHVIRPQSFQRCKDLVSDLFQSWERLTQDSVFPINLVETFDPCWNDISSFRFLEWMTAEHFLADFWWRLVVSLQQVDQSVLIAAIQSIAGLVSGHRHFFHVLTQLNSSLSVDFNEFVDTAQRRLSLTSHQVSSDAKAIDFVALLVQTENRLLINIVASHNR